MAKPDTDDGWLPYAHELDAALAVADFTKGARVVLREVFAQIFGPAKRKVATLSPSAIGANVGMHREQVSRSIKELLDARVLERFADGTFRFIKDYESWLYKGQARLTHKELAWCRYSPAVAMAYKAGNPFENGSPARDNLVTPPVTESSRDRNNLVTETVTESSRAESSPPDPPIGTGARNLRLETEDVDDDSREGSGLNPIRSAGHKATVDLARELFGDDFAETVVEMGADIERSLGSRWDCYRAAMSRVHESERPVKDLHAYCIRTGGQYAATGIPPKPVAFKPKASRPVAEPEYTKAPADFADHIAGRKKGNA